MNRQPMLSGNGFAVSRDLNPNLVRVESSEAARPRDAQTPARADPQAAGEHRTVRLRPSRRHRVDSRVIAGWGLVLAAKQLGLTEVPAVTIADLDEAKLRMLRLALNRLGEDSSWDLDALTLEFSDILEIEQRDRPSDQRL